MAEQSSSSKLLKKYYKFSNTKQLVVRLNNLPDEKYQALEIKEEKYNRTVEWKNEKRDLKDLVSKNTVAENKKLIVSLIPSMLRFIDADAHSLSDAREMNSPGSMGAGAWVDSAYSDLLRRDRSRRDTLRHILDQLIL